MNLTSIFLDQLEGNYDESHVEKAIEEVNKEFLSQSSVDKSDLRDFWDVAKEFKPMEYLEEKPSFSKLRKEIQDTF